MSDYDHNCKLKPERVQIFLEKLKEGNVPKELCAEASGICKKTFYNWLNRGEADAEKEIESDYSTFYLAVKQIDFVNATVRIKKIETASDIWPRDAWLAERLYPMLFGRNSHYFREMQEQIEQIKLELSNKIVTQVQSNTQDDDF